MTRCRQCGETFTPALRAGKDTRRGRLDRVRSLTAAQFCSARCKQANYRWRKSHVLSRNGNGGLTAPFSAVTRPLENIENTSEFSTISEGARRPQWRWCERLDGSCDLYCDTETNMRHVARIVRRDGHYRLAKPSDLASAVWTERQGAQRAVRNLVRKAA